MLAEDMCRELVHLLGLNLNGTGPTENSFLCRPASGLPARSLHVGKPQLLANLSPIATSHGRSEPSLR